MKWNVIFPDLRTGRLECYDIFKNAWFQSSMQRLLEANYEKERFIKELDRAAIFWFWAKSEYEFMLTEWPAILNVDEVKRIINEYGDSLSDDEIFAKTIKAYPVNTYKVDIYDQLRINWDHFAEYVWMESRKLINRTTIIGHKLYDDCFRAKTTINEYEEYENRILCYGLTQRESLTEICEKCLHCKAYIHNADSLREERGETRKDE